MGNAFDQSNPPEWLIEPDAQRLALGRILELEAKIGRLLDESRAQKAQIVDFEDRLKRRERHERFDRIDYEEQMFEQRAVARFFRVSQQTIKAWRDSGKLEHVVTYGGQIRYTRRQILKCLERQKRPVRFKAA